MASIKSNRVRKYGDDETKTKVQKVVDQLKVTGTNLKNLEEEIDELSTNTQDYLQEKIETSIPYEEPYAFKKTAKHFQRILKVSREIDEKEEELAELFPGIVHYYNETTESLEKLVQMYEKQDELNEKKNVYERELSVENIAERVVEVVHERETDSNCPVCHRIFHVVGCKKVLNCGHVFCGPCVDRTIGRVCPVCNATVENVMEVFF